ncbi:hypothetical protein J437_LFUL006610 [Ladona fulva]|uniref:Uncharacterized protein n=1 Tax=Ladona fulva TaxID=123851 RepID=A0A8K0KM58_LADFU|nr:hypothetical protein J437_LFUL006610 [Ladona fulva]
MPTTNQEEDQLEEAYEKLANTLYGIKGDANLFVMGDWNAVVGEGVDGRVVGPYGLGARNERGDRLVEFCTNHHLVVKWMNDYGLKLKVDQQCCNGQMMSMNL